MTQPVGSILSGARVSVGNGQVRPAQALRAALLVEIDDDDEFSTWFRPLRVRSENNGHIVFEVPNDHFLDALEQSYRPIIDKTAATLGITKVDFVLPKEQQTASSPQRQQGLNPTMTFETFVRSACNEFAVAAVHAVIERLGVLYNPLVIYGGKGMGKTHLLQAIAHKLFAAGKVPLMRSREQIVNEYGTSVERNRVTEFRFIWGSADVVLIDNVDAAVGKEPSVRQLLWVISNALEQGKQVILSCSHDPRGESFPANLKEIVLRGLLPVALHTPSQDDLVTVLSGILSGMGVTMPVQMVQYALALGSPTSIGSVAGIAQAVHFYRAVSPLEPWESLLVRALQPNDGVALQDRSDEVEVSKILQKVADATLVSAISMRSDSKDRAIVQARHVAMFLLHERRGIPYTRIGLHLGKDHSTVQYGVRKVRQALATGDKWVSSLLEQLLAT